MRQHGPYATLIALLTAPLLAAVTLLPARTKADDSTPPPDRRILVSAGSGVMEFAHAEVGYFLDRRIALEAQYKWAFFNHMVGIGATGYYSGFPRPDGPPRFSLLAGGSLLVNPTLDHLQIRSGDDYLGSAAILYHGWAFNSDAGFMLRILGGGLIYERNGPKATPILNLGAGYIF